MFYILFFLMFHSKFPFPFVYFRLKLSSHNCCHYIIPLPTWIFPITKFAKFSPKDKLWLVFLEEKGHAADSSNYLEIYTTLRWEPFSGIYSRFCNGTVIDSLFWQPSKAILVLELTLLHSTNFLELIQVVFSSFHLLIGKS